MNKKLLIIGFVWPEPKSSAAGVRMLQLITVFKNEGYQITFASPCAKSDNAINLEHVGIHQVAIELNNTSFDVFINKLQPHIVIFDRFMMEEQFGWRVAEHCPDALRILDTEDLHGLRKGRQQAFKEGKVFNDSYLFNTTTKREIASIYRSDLTLIISEAEIDLLQKKFKVPNSLIVYLPFMLNYLKNEDIECLPEFEDRNHFITIGNFLHEPNYNAVLYLKETIWPLIKKKLPNAELHIYGAYTTQKVNQLNNKAQGFLVKGFAKNVDEVMRQAKVCLAPIRFGAGLKGKIIDAMKNGTPCITTSIGAEGLFSEFEINGFIADTPELFVSKAVALFNNPTLWKEKQHNGFQIINNRFNKNKHENNFLMHICKTQNNLQKHRLNNFTGQMLQHHTLQSTKFMSKWIEEKNKAN